MARPSQKKSGGRKSKKTAYSGSTWKWIQENIHTLDAIGGVKPFPDYSFLERLVNALDKHRILIVGKSRQMLATWTICAFTLYRMLHGDPGIYLLLSKGARDTGELVKRLNLMISQLKEEYRGQLKVKSSEVICETGSRIIALPATEDAVRMHSPSGVFWEEMAFTPYSEAIWAAVKPAIDSGGSFFGVSTPNGTDNIFYQLYSDTENGFGKLTMHWKEHPQRGEEWKKEAQRGLSDARWKQEYEVDFDVLADRVYDEYDPQLHDLLAVYKWQKETGKTYRGIDFGYRHPYVVWAQLLSDGTLIVFDEWEGKDATVEDLALAINRIDSRHGISEQDVTLTGVDPAGAAQSDLGISAVERLQNNGFKLAWRTSEIMTGVELVKSRLKDARGTVRLKFSPQAKQTLYHLRHYRWETGKDRPCKDDGHDHAMDALRYMILNIFGLPTVPWSRARVEGAKWRAR